MGCLAYTISASIFYESCFSRAPLVRHGEKLEQELKTDLHGQVSMKCE